MFRSRLKDLSESIQGCHYAAEGQTLTCEEALHKASELLLKTREKGGVVYVVGNGGSAGIASHFHTDLVKTLQIPAQTLYDPNLVTCLSNDYGYEHVFSATLKLMMTPRDLLVAISSSGRSSNILNAIQVAQEKGAQIFTLSGFAADNPLRQAGHLNYYIGSSEYGLVEMGHFFLLHTIIDYLQKQCSIKSNP